VIYGEREPIRIHRWSRGACRVTMRRIWGFYLYSARTGRSLSMLDEIYISPLSRHRAGRLKCTAVQTSSGPGTGGHFADSASSTARIALAGCRDDWALPSIQAKISVRVPVQRTSPLSS
jgi:hypothetical protein